MSHSLFYQNKKSVTSNQICSQWNADDLAALWAALRARNSGESRPIHIWACFDECQELEALRILHDLDEERQFQEALNRIVILTTRGTPQDQQITEHLSRMSNTALVTVECSYHATDAFHRPPDVPLLLQQDPRYVDRHVRTKIAGLVSSCGQSDGDLRDILLAVLKLSQDHEKVIKALESFTPTPDQVFRLALEGVPEARRSWARNVLSWLLISLRPLRVYEFSVVSQLCRSEGLLASNHQPFTREHPRLRYDVDQAIADFQGLLVVKHDEIRFSHLQLRSWLVSHVFEQATLGSGTPWYYGKTKGIQHEDVWNMSVAYLEHLSHCNLGNAPEPRLLLPYAVEHWTYHYKEAGSTGTAAVIEKVFSDQRVLDYWVLSYSSLPTPFIKPLKASSQPLAIAAHFGLDDVVQALLKQGSHSSEAWGLAMAESIRIGSPLTRKVIFGSSPLLLAFDDALLQELVEEASHSEDAKTFSDMVDRIPECPEPVSYSDSLESGLIDVQGASTSDRREAQDRDDELVVQQNNPAELRTSLEEQQHDQGDQEPDKRARGHDRATAFHWLSPILYQACRRGLSQVAKQLLILGADPNSLQRSSTDREVRSALAAACFWRHTSTVKILLEHGADPDMRSGPGHDMPLFFACRGGSAAVVSLLLERGASVESSDPDGWMALDVACDWGSFAVVDVLLKHKSFQDYSNHTTNELSRHPLLVAARYGNYKVVRRLLCDNIDPNSHLSEGSALSIAAEEGHLHVCQLLLDRGASPNFAPESLTPPLIQAIKHGSMEIVRLLVDRGADINIQEVREGLRQTPLLTAVFSAPTEDSFDVWAVQYLLDKKADHSIGDEDGWTPLWTAAQKGVGLCPLPSSATQCCSSSTRRLRGFVVNHLRYQYVELAKALCQADADVNVVCGLSGNTPLHAAVSSPQTMSVLLDHGADVNAVNSEGETPVSRVFLFAILLSYSCLGTP